jgi:hypothetical protein
MGPRAGVSLSKISFKRRISDAIECKCDNGRCFNRFRGTAAFRKGFVVYGV